MKKKTIEKTIRKLLDKLSESVPEDRYDLKDIFKNHTIVTGGCIASMLLSEDVNDFDIYFDSMDNAKAIAEYYTGTEAVCDEDDLKGDMGVLAKGGRIKVYIRSSGIHYCTAKEDYDPVVFTGNAISLKGDVQLILRFFGTPSEIHKNYDYVHCTSYYYQGKVYLNADAMEALLARELRYTGSRYPLCSMIRTRKFLKRGWSINAGQYLKMAMQLGELDLTDVEVLEDQLTGVDSAYFSSLIEKIKAGTDIENMSSYVLDLVDEIFSEDPNEHRG